MDTNSNSMLLSQEKHVTANIRKCTRRRRRKMMNLFLRHWSVEPSQLILVERKKKIRTSLCWRKYCVSMKKNGWHFKQFSGPNTAPSNIGPIRTEKPVVCAACIELLNFKQKIALLVTAAALCTAIRLKKKGTPIVPLWQCWKGSFRWNWGTLFCDNASVHECSFQIVKEQRSWHCCRLFF